jgi:hypothetical protein
MVLVLKAAASQRRAAYQLTWAAAQVGSINTGWFRELREANTDAECVRIFPKFLLQCWRADGGKHLLESVDTDAHRDEIIKRQAALFEKDARIMGRKKATERWAIRHVAKLRKETVSEKIASQLVSNWLRSDIPGNPGWCFFSDPALAQIIAIEENLPRLSAKHVQKVCKRLRLEKGPRRIVSAKLDQCGQLWRFGDIRGKEFVGARTAKSIGQPDHRRTKVADGPDISAFKDRSDL